MKAALRAAFIYLGFQKIFVESVAKQRSQQKSSG
jgi:hypothetical protein